MLKLSLNIKPYSVNAYYYGNRSIKRREAREWEINMIDLLKSEEYQKNIKKLTEKFDPKLHCMLVSIICTYPQPIFFTKKGTISSKTFDISNTEKPIIDTMFLQKYATSTIKNIGIDDKYITDMSSKKRPGEHHNISITIRLKPLDYLTNK